MTPDTLDSWLEFISRQHAQVIDLGLERVSRVLARMGVSRPALGRVITVGGTNGKGSTVASLERLLLAQGYRVATYTSPHLLRYNERVRFGGQDLSDEQLAAGFSRVESARGETPLTYFEYGTLCALTCFEQLAPDFCILEVGLGGRLDAVNVVDADLAILTTIDIDHVDWLGSDREVIGAEKAGILRNGAFFVCGDLNPPGSVERHAQELGCQSYWRNRDFAPMLSDRGRWSWRGKDRSGVVIERDNLPEPGVPVDNVAAAFQALALLDLLPEEPVLAEVLNTLCVAGRFQKVVDHRVVFLDVGHNPQAARYLRQRMEAVGGRWLAVYSALSDKDMGQVIRALSGGVDRWYCAPLASERAATRTQLEHALTNAGESQIRWADTVADAFRLAVADAQPDQKVLVFGSFYTVEVVLRLLQEQSDSSA